MTRNLMKLFKPLTWRLRLFLANPASAKYAVCRRFYNMVVLSLPYKQIQCNVCGWKGYRFRAIAGADYIRYNAGCPGCGSAERQRALIQYLDIRGDFDKAGIRCLDIGPVAGFKAYFKAMGCDYISIDLESASAMMKMDAAKMEFPDDTFDIIIASHVLEHIKDDIQAIKEMFRVLRSSGACFIMVPFSKNRTDTIEYKKPNLLDPGHVRSYGLDISDRIESVGFKVEKIDLVSEANNNDVRRYGLGLEEICFICTKNIN